MGEARPSWARELRARELIRPWITAYTAYFPVAVPYSGVAELIFPRSLFFPFGSLALVSGLYHGASCILRNICELEFSISNSMLKVFSNVTVANGSQFRSDRESARCN